MIEFTGERVIPGHVEDDLWAEHIARYAFAARFAAGRRVLDLGCGTGYGTAELARHATEAVGVDIAADAIDYASAHYRAARFVLASAEDVPLHDASFDVVVAFELIEHLSDWRLLLEQTRRVLHPGGVFIVSTPNTLYYAQARGAAGPNPFHVHEFEYAEFCSALQEFFPHVKILMQDRLESFAFYEPGAPGMAQAQLLRVSNNPSSSNFFVAVCSLEPLPRIQPFVFVPQAANLLREREDHIRKLLLERQEIKGWLDETMLSRDRLLVEYRELEGHLEEKNNWALSLDEQLKDAQHRIVELQEQHSAEQTQAIKLAREFEEKAQWAQRLNEDLQAAERQIAELRDLHAGTQGTAGGFLARQLESAQLRIVELQEKYTKEQAQAMAIARQFEEKSQWALRLDEQRKTAERRILELQEKYAAEQTQAMAIARQFEEKSEWALKLDEQLKAAERRVLELQEKYAAEQTQAIAIARQLEEKSEWGLKLDEQRKTAERRLVELQEKYTEEQTQATMMARQFEEKSQWALSLDEQRKTAETRILELQEKYAAEQTQAMVIARQLEEKSEWALKLDELLKTAQRRVTELQEQYSTQKVEAAAITQEFEGKNQLVQSLQEQLNAAQRRNVELQESYATQQARTVAIMGQFDEKDGRALDLGDQLKASQQHITEMQRDYEAQQSETTKIIEGLKVAVEEKAAWALETGRKLQHHQQEIETTTKTLDQAKQAATESANRAEHLARERDALRDRVEQLQRSVWVKLGSALGLGPKFNS